MNLIPSAVQRIKRKVAICIDMYASAFVRTEQTMFF